MTGSKLAAVVLSCVGFVLSLVGLMVGLLPHSVSSTSCGSGFSPNPFIVWTTECIALTDGARTLALVLLVPGLISLAVGGALWLADSSSKRPAQAELQSADA